MAEDHSAAGLVPQAAQQIVDQILDLGINGFGPWQGAVEMADDHLRTATSREDAIQRLITTHLGMAAAYGFVTGLGGILTLPITVPVGLGGMLVISTHMVAGIAHLRGYDPHTDEVRSALLITLLGGAGVEVLAQAGVKIGTKSAMAALRRLPGRILIEINKKVGFRLVTKCGQKGLVNLGKLVPCIGGPIGATIDVLGCRSIAGWALVNFPARSRRRARQRAA